MNQSIATLLKQKISQEESSGDAEGTTVSGNVSSENTTGLPSYNDSLMGQTSPSSAKHIRHRTSSTGTSVKKLSYNMPSMSSANVNPPENSNENLFINYLLYDNNDEIKDLHSSYIVSPNSTATNNDLHDINSRSRCTSPKSNCLSIQPTDPEFWEQSYIPYSADMQVISTAFTQNDESLKFKDSKEKDRELVRENLSTSSTRRNSFANVLTELVTLRSHSFSSLKNNTSHNHAHCHSSHVNFTNQNQNCHLNSLASQAIPPSRVATYSRSHSISSSSKAPISPTTNSIANPLNLNQPDITLDMLPKPPKPISLESVESYLLELSNYTKFIGRILSENDSTFTKQCLEYYMMNCFEFQSIPLDIALRQVLEFVDLPKETQQIDRLLLTFSKAYFEQNSQSFWLNDDQVYFLTFSLLILHTDYFNPNNKYKMTKKEFVELVHKDRDSFGFKIPIGVLSYFYENVISLESIKLKYKDLLKLQQSYNTDTIFSPKLLIKEKKLINISTIQPPSVVKQRSTSLSALHRKYSTTNSILTTHLHVSSNKPQNNALTPTYSLNSASTMNSPKNTPITNNSLNLQENINIYEYINQNSLNEINLLNFFEYRDSSTNVEKLLNTKFHNKLIQFLNNKKYNSHNLDISNDKNEILNGNEIIYNNKILNQIKNFKGGYLRVLPNSIKNGKEFFKNFRILNYTQDNIYYFKIIQMGDIKMLEPRLNLKCRSKSSSALNPNPTTAAAMAAAATSTIKKIPLVNASTSSSLQSISEPKLDPTSMRRNDKSELEEEYGGGGDGGCEEDEEDNSIIIDSKEYIWKEKFVILTIGGIWIFDKKKSQELTTYMIDDPNFHEEVYIVDCKSLKNIDQPIIYSNFFVSKEFSKDEKSLFSKIFLNSIKLQNSFDGYEINNGSARMKKKGENLNIRKNNSMFEIGDNLEDNIFELFGLHDSIRNEQDRVMMTYAGKFDILNREIFDSHHNNTVWKCKTSSERDSWVNCINLLAALDKCHFNHIDTITNTIIPSGHLSVEEKLRNITKTYQITFKELNKVQKHIQMYMQCIPIKHKTKNHLIEEINKLIIRMSELYFENKKNYTYSQIIDELYELLDTTTVNSISETASPSISHSNSTTGFLLNDSNLYKCITEEEL
ncbi:hypothetical protein TBLA_0C02470 [Henningerozyma blattae CBS 6284]|uniref:SEC7 domain-containing protein n=1 Tax=Henningerozyma blattae (strain ATCC 34711 / CBS 6284 / DSM 70876 / NBRC 10599 / NRRL Y-10934 / UCD 77-7) TaxID=1071380 RepID=I2H105_HENB6|nr:hypothetical protein TBLA_0C02470 [Tetrapisispora blattae CBS 6284]CCH60057.1 hypothetical protein TBLA_0C02470 [Tetrapisispora blattae CBS 6284]